MSSGRPGRRSRSAWRPASALYLACFLLAPALAGTLNAPSATGLLRLMALGVVIDGCSSIPNALLTRNFLQGKRMIADLAGFVVSASITVTLAATGHGATSLALGILSSNLTATVLILLMAPSRPCPAGTGRMLASCCGSGCRWPRPACSGSRSRTSTTSWSGT